MHLPLCKIDLYDCIYISTTPTGELERLVAVEVAKDLEREKRRKGER